MKFENSEGRTITNSKIVNVKVMNHLVEVVSVKNTQNGFENIQKLNKTEYVLKDTGEILEYNLSENRAQNTSGLKHTFRKIRDLINNNFTGWGNELHLTLTYKDNMTDTNQLYSDFKNFWKRYKYKYGKDIDYMTVVEPQGRGAWHCHVLIRHNSEKNVFIPSDELDKLWGHGFIKIKSLKGVDNIGAYLSAYLGDVELTQENVSFAVSSQKEIKVVGDKKYIKGGRLHMYPPGMNLYRHSKGIEFPEVQKMAYKETKKIVGSRIPNYSRTVTIVDDENDNKVLNQVTYEYYNMKRAQKEINVANVTPTIRD